MPNCALLFASAAWHKLRAPAEFRAVLAAYRVVPDPLVPTLGATIGVIDIVTLNPPRKGASAAVLEAIAAAHPRRIVYVSCEPRTLARDLERLAELGYRTARVRLFDMLPQTEHVETVSLLVPRGHAEDVPVEQ